MTTEQRDILIEKMIDKPHALTPDEIELILSDKELRDLYEVSAKLADEYCQVPDIDVKEEWSSLRGRLTRNDSRPVFKRRWWISAAAAIIAILVCGGIVFNRASDGESDFYPSRSAGVTVAKSLRDFGDSPSRSAGDTIRRAVSKKVKSQTKSKHEEADIEEYMRIEEARIDNEVALMLSRVYEEEYSMEMKAIADMIEQRAERGDSTAVKYVNSVNINQLTIL